MGSVNTINKLTESGNQKFFRLNNNPKIQSFALHCIKCNEVCCTFVLELFVAPLLLNLGLVVFCNSEYVLAVIFQLYFHGQYVELMLLSLQY
jgi:hypothetical protein